MTKGYAIVVGRFEVLAYALLNYGIVRVGRLPIRQQGGGRPPSQRLLWLPGRLRRAAQHGTGEQVLCFRRKKEV